MVISMLRILKRLFAGNVKKKERRKARWHTKRIDRYSHYLYRGKFDKEKMAT